MFVQHRNTMKISRKNALILSSIVSATVLGVVVFSLFLSPANKDPEIIIGRAVDDLNPQNIAIQEPPVTVEATADNLDPNVRMFVPANPTGKSTFLILVENYSIANAEGVVDRTHQPPIPLVKKGIPTPVDVVIASTLPGENGTFYVALVFSYCAPLYLHNGQSGPCIEKDLAVSLPQHIVSLNQHFNVTVTAPDGIPSGLYQLGILARTKPYSNEATNQQMTGSSQEPFWIRVVEDNTSSQSVSDSAANPLSTERPIYTIWGNYTKVHNGTDASLLAGYDVKFPSKLPDNYTLKLAVMRPLLPEHKYVYLFYSKFPISDSMPLHDFWHDRGIMIRYDYNPNWMHDPTYGNWTGYINGEKEDGYPDAHDVIIDGYKGWAGSNHTGNLEGWPIQRPSVIEFQAKGVEVQLFGGVSLDELTAVARSIPY